MERIEIQGTGILGIHRLVLENNVITYYKKNDILEQQMIEKSVLINYFPKRNISPPELTIILSEKGCIKFELIAGIKENLENFDNFINAVLPDIEFLNYSTKALLKLDTELGIKNIAKIKYENDITFDEAQKVFRQKHNQLKAEAIQKQKEENEKRIIELNKKKQEMKVEFEEAIGKGDKFKEIVSKIKKNQTGFLIPVKNEAAKAARLLSDYETLVDAFVVHAATCPVGGNYKPDYFKTKNKSYQILIITNKRLFFVESFLGKEAVKQMMLKDITSIDHKTTHFITAKLRVICHTEMFVFDSDKTILQNIYKALNDARFADDAPPVIQQTVVQTQQPEQRSKSLNDIEVLADLHARGILTDDEFAAKKKQLLGV